MDTDFLRNLFNQTMSMMEQISFPITDELIESIKQMLTPIGMAMQYHWANAMVGIVVSLVVAFFVRKEKSIVEN